MIPNVSILMPVRNRENYLPAALNSLCAQTFMNWELIVVDDGSTDSTPELLHQYAAKDSRIRTFYHPAATIAENRNYALSKANGEYIAILDSDDIAMPERLEKQLAFLHAHPNLGGIGSGFDFIDANGAPIQVDKYKQRLTDPDELRQRQREGWSCFMHTSMLFRRFAVNSVGGYRTHFKLAEDDDLFLRLLDHFDLANMPKSLVHYRWHGGNTTGSLDSFIHRAVALASAHFRMAGLPDKLNEMSGPINYPYFLNLMQGLGDAAVPVWLMWIGLLQHYRVGEPGMLEKAWEALGALPFQNAVAAEITRHWGDYKGDFDFKGSNFRGDDQTIRAWLRDNHIKEGI